MPTTPPSADQQIRFARTADGVHIAYGASGSGPPLVKAANWLSHLEFDWNSPVWQHWLDTFSTHHSLVRYDQRGCGLSDWEIPELSLDAWVRDLEAVVEAAGLERFPLLGISQGGPIAIAYAARHPDKVSHLILHGSYARGRLHRDPTTDQLREIEMMHEMISLGWGRSNPAFRQVFTSLFIPEATPEQMQWFNDLQRVSTSPENAVRIRRAFSELNVTELARTIGIPTLITHPRNDAVVPFDEGRRLATLIPGSRFVPLEGRNHILLADEPGWGRFMDEVYRFLGLAPGAASVTAAAGPAGMGGPVFTLREREVLELLAQGLDNRAIAAALVLSPKTVRNYVSILLGKLDAHSRGEAIVRAREAGFGQRGAAG